MDKMRTNACDGNDRARMRRGPMHMMAKIGHAIYSHHIYSYYRKAGQYTHPFVDFSVKIRSKNSPSSSGLKVQGMMM